MRELTLSEIDFVAGGYQQSSGYEDPGDGGGGGGNPGGTGDGGPQVPLVSMIAPAQLVLQQFFDDLTYHEGFYDSSSASGYDHEAGGDYAAPPSNWLGIPSHDPSVNAPYWSGWDGDTDPEFFQAVMAGTPSHVIDGLISLPGTPLNNTVAIKDDSNGSYGAFVNGIFYSGLYHEGDGSAPPVTGPDIVVTARQGGYWTFTVDGSGAVQNNFGTTANIPAVSNALAGINNLNGTTGYPTGWDVNRDHDIDTLALDLANKIQNKVDSSLREYSAYIWRDGNGALHESSILIGNFTDAGATDGSGQMNPMSNYNIPAGATLVAMIHNHPEFFTTTNPTTGAIVSRLPNPASVYTDTGDMNSMTFTVNNYPVDIVNGINYYRNYIAHGSSVDEYDFTQHQTGMIPGPAVLMMGAVKGDFNP